MIDKICEELNLGSLISTEMLFGGETNIVYKVKTTIGEYVIKLINSDRVKHNKKLISNIEKSEIIAVEALKNGVNAICAIKFKNKYVQCFNKQYFLVFKYFDGKVLLSREIKLKHVKKLAIELAKLHSIKVKKRKINFKYKKIDYKKYYNLLENTNEEWVLFFKENFNDLYNIYELVFNNYKKLSNQTVCIHNDYNRKNILWKNDIPYIIDWETASFGNPSIDFFLSAWFLTDDVDEKKYRIFVKTYFSMFKLKDNVHISIYAAIVEECNWLCFSLERALGLYSKSESEITLGKNAIVPSLTEIINYYRKIPVMIKITEEIINDG